MSTLGILAIASLVWFTPPPGSLWGVGARVAMVVGVCLASFYYHDLYDFEGPQDFVDLFGRLCRALGWSALVLALTYLLFPTTMLGANLASHALLALLVVTLAIRAAVYGLAKRAPFTQRVLIIGDSALAGELARNIRTRSDLALRLVGVLTTPGDGGAAGGPYLGTYEDVGAVVRRYRPDRIVVAMPDRRGRLPVSQLLACRVRGVRIEEGTQLFERIARRLAVESLNPSTLIFGDGFRVTRARLLVKRTMSVAIAVAALVAAAPFMALVAIGIKLETPGPVFFIQERVGLRGRIFRLIKFRTMRVAEERETVIRDNTSRVTRLGAVLRRYRLDELPQFINILRGDMSLVGPRPEMAPNVATFSASIPFYNLRHEVRPGLTGWAQVKAGYSMSLQEVTRKLCYDLYYIKHMSLLFDLRILFDTVKFVLCGKRPG
jgi:exopolysaccharide biosynthesis polyprenyl glycosylphosphotransferase